MPKIVGDEDTSNYPHVENPLDDMENELIDNSSAHYQWTHDF